MAMTAWALMGVSLYSGYLSYRNLLVVVHSRIAATLLFAVFLEAPAEAVPPAWLHIALAGRTVHNSHYMAASFLYQLQTLLGTEPSSPKVMQGKIVRRQGKELYIDLEQVPSERAGVLRQIAAQKQPADEIGLDEMSAFMGKHYYELTRPYATLQALLRDYPYRDNPNWLTVPVDSETFHRRRILRVDKDKIAAALISYFDNNDRLIYPQGTVIAAESFDKKGEFVEAEILRKRGDSFWDFSAYNHTGALIPSSVAFNEEGEIAPEQAGFKIPQDCATCHRIDRLDLSGDPEAPARVPIRAFFHRLPARVPQIHLGPEYYDHMAFTELTESNAKQKDSVFGVYGSLLLSELASRKRLSTLTDRDKKRYGLLRPYYPELLTPLDRVDSLTNSIGMRLVRIPTPVGRVTIGSLASDRDHQPDEQSHPLQLRQGFFMAMYKQTNAEFRRFRPNHHVPLYHGLDLDGDNQPVVNVSYDDAQAFVDWLNHLPAERSAGRTYRLPTEEEWEYAAQGGDGRRFPWGDQWPPPPDSGNFADEANGELFKWEYLHGYRDPYLGTSPVDKFFPNPYFLYDMAGNAYEWTSSIYEPYPGASASGLKQHGSQWRVLKGSSWADELPKVLRCAFRNPFAPETRLPFMGFRVVADIPSLWQ
jgi:formylglycine-generating enzyme required for sulfatase activity